MRKIVLMTLFLSLILFFSIFGGYVNSDDLIQEDEFVKIVQIAKNGGIVGIGIKITMA
jgi:hypothetical protein